ncbi:MAG: hypothetical protein RIF42_10190 [Parvibaculaceae bacterium]
MSFKHLTAVIHPVAARLLGGYFCAGRCFEFREIFARAVVSRHRGHRAPIEAKAEVAAALQHFDNGDVRQEPGEFGWRNVAAVGKGSAAALPLPVLIERDRIRMLGRREELRLAIGVDQPCCRIWNE